MKTGEILHGFAVQSREFIPEEDGVLWQLKHEKLDTPLLFLERADSNKSFYIAFKTPPADDSGVFHIIEHSVLCGSEKFPVKEPFVELLKSSLKTFLNAMTCPDKTVYPVSSRSDKDFLNLIDVYMDAVFHPLMLKNENIFMQEGHRYELENKDAPLGINGVVYNEMKGAMSSPDEISGEALLSMLYKDSPFGKNSGGDPDAIKALSYSQFCEAHRKHYHPSNAFIFLDGEVDLDSVLPLLDSYLSEFEKRENKISVGGEPAVESAERCIEYEISPEENPEGKLRAYFGVRTFDFDNVEKSFMLSVLADAIAATNDSPLVKAFLDEGLCEDVALFPLGSGIKYGSYGIELKNLSCDAERAYSHLRSALVKIADGGIGKERLQAALNSAEFKLREKDFGSLPKGLVLGIAMLDCWIYGAEPSLGLKYEMILESVRKKIDTDAFEELLRDVFIDNKRTVKLTLIPSATLGKEREERERRELEKEKAAMTQSQIREILSQKEAFEAWQSTPDSEEKLNTLPTLSIDDIPKKGCLAPTEIIKAGDAQIILHNIPTGGISYVDLFFDISDLDGEELAQASALLRLLGKSATADYTADELSQFSKSELGTFTANISVYCGREGSATPYVQISASALDSKRESLLKFLSQVLNTTRFEDKKAIKNILTQALIAKKESFVSSGHTAALKRARAYVSEGGVIGEYTSGTEYYRVLKGTLSDFDARFPEFSKKQGALLEKITSKKRLKIAFTGTPCEVFFKALAEIPLADGPLGERKSHPPFGNLNEGFVIPSRVSYIAKTASLSDIGESFTGSMHVLSNLLSYTHFWNAIRVKGGAYGAGFAIRRSGDACVYSYRDPNPAASVEAASEAAEFIRAFAEEEDSLDSYIIGTFGDYDSLHSARSAGDEATTMYMTGKSEQEERQTRESMLAFDKNELLRLGGIVDALMASQSVCIFGPAEQLQGCMHILKTQIEI